MYDWNMKTARFTNFDKIGISNILNLPISGLVVETIDDLSIVRNHSLLPVIFHNLNRNKINYNTFDLFSRLRTIHSIYPTIKALTLFNEIVVDNTGELKPIQFDIAAVVSYARDLLPNTRLLIGDYRLSDKAKWTTVSNIADKYDLDIWLQIQHNIDHSLVSVAKNHVYFNLYRHIISNYRCWCSEISVWGPTRLQYFENLYDQIGDKVESFGPWVTDIRDPYHNLAVDRTAANVSWLNYGKPTEIVELLCPGKSMMS